MLTETDVMLKEYETLRAEIQERIKAASTLLGFAGAIASFTFVSAEQCEPYGIVRLIVGSVGALVLAWLSYVNWQWVERIASHIRLLETRISAKVNADNALSWENSAQAITRCVLCPPRKYPDRDHNKESAPAT